MLRRWLVFAVLSFFLVPNAVARSKAEPPYHFHCSAKVDSWTCERQLGLVRRIIERQKAPLPANWTWLVVDDSEWPVLRQRYRLKHDFAFTHMGERRTVFNSLLFRVFERPVWEWAVAHESAHITCDLVDDSMADRVSR